MDFSSRKVSRQCFLNTKNTTSSAGAEAATQLKACAARSARVPNQQANEAAETAVRLHSTHCCSSQKPEKSLHRAAFWTGWDAREELLRGAGGGTAGWYIFRTHSLPQMAPELTDTRVSGGHSSVSV